MLSNLVFAAMLFAISLALLFHHQWAWRVAQREASTARDLEFSRRRYRRRLQTSGMIGVVAVAIVAGGFIEETKTAVFFWLGVCVLVMWIGFLAFADWASSYAHFKTVHKRQLAEHAALHAELTAELNRRRQQRNEGESGSTER